MTTYIATVKAQRPIDRAWRALTDDRLSQLLLAALAVVLGGLAARVAGAGTPIAPGSRATGTRRAGRERRPVPSLPLAAAGLAALVLGPAVVALSVTLKDALPGGLAGALWDTATVVAAAAVGFLVVAHLRTRAQTVVEVVDAEGTVLENSSLGTLVVSEVASMAGSQPGGVFAVRGGTDVQDPAVTAALDAVSQSVLKVLVTVWKAISTGLGDRVRIALVGTAEDPVATLVYRRGARVLIEERLDTRELRVDRSAPSATEKTSVNIDLASAIAARLVLVALGVLPRGDGREAPSRLHQVTEPRSLALCAVAARHAESRRHPEATELFARATGIDPRNRTARFGRAVNVLRVTPNGSDGLAALKDLEALSAELSAEERARERMERERRENRGPQPLRDTNPLSWRCRYTVVVQRTNRILTGGVPPTGHRSGRLLSAYGDAARSLLRDLDAVQARAEAEGVAAGDVVLARRLRDLTTPVEVGLRTFDRARTPDWDLLRRLLTVNASASVATMVNRANGFVLLSVKAPGRAPRRDVEAAVDLMRLAGLEVRMRPGLVAEPILRLLRHTKPYRALVAEWNLEEAVPYAGLSCIGAETAKKAAQWYPTVTGLRRAVKAADRTVAARVGRDVSELRWWRGALDWLAIGAAVDVVNAYQAAGIVDAAHADRIGDARVVGLLRARKADDATIVIPDARVRALMATTS